MNKYSVIEAAEILGISKEAVYNRIRRNTLNSVTEGGIKYVILSDEDQSPKTPSNKTTKRNFAAKDDRYIELLHEQIKALQERIQKLEQDKEKLILEKEQLLINSRDEVERIYTQRDKQLKQIVSLVTRPLVTYMQKQNKAIDADFEELTPYERGLVLKNEVGKWINAQEYMQEKGYSDKKKKNLSEQLLDNLGKNKNIKEENGVLFIKRGVKIKQILGKKK